MFWLRTPLKSVSIVRFSSFFVFTVIERHRKPFSSRLEKIAPTETNSGGVRSQNMPSQSVRSQKRFLVALSTQSGYLTNLRRSVVAWHRCFWAVLAPNQYISAARLSSYISNEHIPLSDESAPSVRLAGNSSSASRRQIYAALSDKLYVPESRVERFQYFVDHLRVFTSITNPSLLNKRMTLSMSHNRNMLIFVCT